MDALEYFIIASLIVHFIGASALVSSIDEETEAKESTVGKKLVLNPFWQLDSTFYLIKRGYAKTSHKGFHVFDIVLINFYLLLMAIITYGVFSAS